MAIGHEKFKGSEYDFDGAYVTIANPCEQCGRMNKHVHIPFIKCRASEPHVAAEGLTTCAQCGRILLIQLHWDVSVLKEGVTV